MDTVCQGTPPTCCQPPMSDAEWAETGRRLRATHDEALARQPRCCPSCQSRDIAPTFLPFGADDWECLDCLATWREG